MSDAEALVAGHIDRHGGYVAWSGGKDSTVVVHLAQRVRPGVPVVWFDSGLEFPETRDHIASLADAWGLNLHVIRAEPDALTVMRESGAWDVRDDVGSLQAHLHEVLILGPACEAHERFGAGSLLGLRAEESAKRRRVIERTLVVATPWTVGCTPVGRWTGADVLAYHALHDIPLCGVYGVLERVGCPEDMRRCGLVIDGLGLRMGRAVWLRRGWPDLWADLCRELPMLRSFT